MWESIKDYYTTIGDSYHVNPVIFIGIHLAATPLFLLSVAWLVKNHRQNRSVVAPLILSVFLFNAANIYLVIWGKDIPWWIYTVLILTTLISGYFSYKKIRKKLRSS